MFKDLIASLQMQSEVNRTLVIRNSPLKLDGKSYNDDRGKFFSTNWFISTGISCLMISQTPEQLVAKLLSLARTEPRSLNSH